MHFLLHSYRYHRLEKAEDASAFNGGRLADREKSFCLDAGGLAAAFDKMVGKREMISQLFRQLHFSPPLLHAGGCDCKNTSVLNIQSSGGREIDFIS